MEQTGHVAGLRARRAAVVTPATEAAQSATNAHRVPEGTRA